MHLLLRDGALLPSPVPVPLDGAGAAALADLYAVAPPPGGVHVRAMMNTTIDGAIAGADGTSGSLHEPEDSFVFGVLRALTDVVLVGAQTVRVEDYRVLGGRRDLLRPSRRPSGAERPALAIWSRSGNLPDHLDREQPTYLVTGADTARSAAARSGLPASHVIVADTPSEAVAALAGRGLRAIQAEGGPSTLGRLAAEGLLDELCFTTTHRTVGGSGTRVLHGAEHGLSWELSSQLLGERVTISRYRRRPDRSSGPAGAER